MRKYITIFLAILLLAAAFGVSSKLKNRKKPSMAMRTQLVPMAFTQKVENKKMPVIIPSTGSLMAKNKIKLYTEVQGVLEISSREFKPGERFKKGELIYKLNSDEFYTNLLAQKSSFQNLVVSIMPDIRLDFGLSYENWQSYLENFDIKKPLKSMPEPLTEKEKRFIASKNIYTNYYSIKNLEIKLDKYSAYAPFNGVLTEANVTPGSLVSPGQSIGEFVDPSTFEMEVSINSALVSKLDVGDKVTVKNLEQDTREYIGHIVRINEKVDLNSQTVNLFIELKGSGLKEGMYLKAFIKSKVLDNLVEVPRNLLVNQNQVYTVKDSLLQLANVQVVYQNDQTILLRGLTNGETILAKPVPKAFEGMKVSVYRQ